MTDKPEISTMTVSGPQAIQPAIWPEVGISTEPTPYLRLTGAAGLSLSRGGVTFGAGGTLLSDTYFNLFNLGKWRQIAGDIPLELWLQGRGRFHLTVWAAGRDRSNERIFSEEITLSGGFRLPLEPGEAADQPAIVLFFELTAFEAAHLEDFSWATTASPRQLPQLMLSVTTFKREAAVAATVSRFRAYRAASPLRDHISMIVVDNGQSVTVTPGEGVVIVPNANLGGAGGFSRGLIETRKAGATHCLFMDDDASVHMGAITRTWMCLAYALDLATAVAGAMINADQRWQIWENGAVFDRGCRPLFFGCDMRERQRVLKMEYDSTRPTPPGFYAGWWFFAFPVAQVRHMPFPFFVRGDDVSFSLANNFRTVTLPGVASFQESFTDKASPLTWYLDMRSHLAHHLSLPAKDVGWRGLQRMFFGFYLRTILRFHYESLAAVNLAIEDVLKGPDFFASNADMAERRKDLKAMTVTEAWKPDPNPPLPRHGKCKRPLRALLLLTLNGHLLPFANRLGSQLVIEADDRENFREVYGARQITYLNARSTATYTVQRDRRRFWRETLRLLHNSLTLRRRYRQVVGQWQGQYAGMTSDGFWHEKLEMHPQNSSSG